MADNKEIFLGLKYLFIFR